MNFRRRLIPLMPGEPQPKSLHPVPPGFREETDEEFRTRIKAELASKGEMPGRP